MNINNPTTFGTPSLTLSTSNSSGTGGALRADDTILVYDSTNPTTIAFSASPAVGSAGTSSRRDHTHGMAAEPTPAAATQAEMEAASSTSVLVTPGRTQYHPGVAKLWCKWSNHIAGGSQIAGSYNYTSVVDGGAVGDSDHVIDTDFSGTVYALVTASEQNGTVTIINTIAAGAFTTYTVSNTDGAAIDHTLNYVVGFGEQVDA